LVTVTFDLDAELDPRQLEEAVRAVDFTPTGVRAWIKGRVLEDDPPPGAPPGGVVFEATGTGQRFIVIADAYGDDASIDELRGAAGSVLIISGRAETLDGVDEVVIYLEGVGAPR